MCVVESNACETPIYESTREGINALMVDGYTFDYDILPAPENKPSARGDTDRPVYKGTWKWNGIEHRRSSGCLLDAAKLNLMN